MRFPLLAKAIKRMRRIKCFFFCSLHFGVPASAKNFIKKARRAREFFLSAICFGSGSCGACMLIFRKTIIASKCAISRNTLRDEEKISRLLAMIAQQFRGSFRGCQIAVFQTQKAKKKLPGCEVEMHFAMPLHHQRVMSTCSAAEADADARLPKGNFVSEFCNYAQIAGVRTVLRWIRKVFFYRRGRRASPSW